MIKDCLEDTMFLKNARAKYVRKPEDERSFTKNMGGGIPTVEEVEKTADLYYGPPKRTHFIAWTCSA